MRQRVGVLAVLAMLGGPARANWVQCTATGIVSSGMPTAYLTSVTPMQAGRLRQPNDYRQRLLLYIAAQYKDTRDLQVACMSDADQLTAITRYENSYAETARRFGWENTRIILPGDWLSHDWLINGENVP